MKNPTYEPIDENLNLPATRADVEKVLRAIEFLAGQIKQVEQINS
jgi:hypothetical protein